MKFVLSFNQGRSIFVAATLALILLAPVNSFAARVDISAQNAVRFQKHSSQSRQVCYVQRRGPMLAGTVTGKRFSGSVTVTRKKRDLNRTIGQLTSRLRRASGNKALQLQAALMTARADLASLKQCRPVVVQPRPAVDDIGRLGCPDYNRDGIVTRNDFNLFVFFYFRGRADFNRDGTTDIQDYQTFLSAWTSFPQNPTACLISSSSSVASSGATSSPSSSSSSVSLSSSSSSSSSTPTTPDDCADGQDNDGNGLTDAADFSCFAVNQRETSVSDDGWTRFSPSSDTRFVYVSVSQGDDCSECGFSPTRPVRTLRRGYELLRNGFPDWLLLKRGDAWVGEALGTGSSWQKSGRSSSEPMVVGGYGVGPRPKILPGNGGGALYALHPISHLAFVGLHLEPHERQWYQAPTGVAFLGAQTSVLFEDLQVRGFGTNFVVQAYSGVPTDITLRRNIIVDSWSATSHSQGIFSSNVEGLRLIENVFDHNGWRDGAVWATLRTATWNARERTLTQAGAFGSASRPERWSPGGWIGITGGLFATGVVVNPDGSATGMVFRGDASLSDVDNYYVGKYLKFTSGANVNDAATNRFQRIIGYTGATREFRVTRTGDEFHPPANGDAFRIDVQGVFQVETRIDDNSIRLVNNDLSIIDLNTGDISSGAGIGATIFNRSMYLSGGTGNVITEGNIDSNGASGGIQQRKGGISAKNLFLRSPLALGFGHAQNNSGTVRGAIHDNVILGARDIENAPRGFGITVTGNPPYQGGPTVYADGVQVYDNIVAHNTLGTTNLFAFELGNFSTNIDFRGNIVYDWLSPTLGGVALLKQSGANISNTLVRDNDFQQPRAGQVISVRDASFLPGQIQFLGNRYYSGSAATGWFYFNNGTRSQTDWGSIASDPSPATRVSYTDPNRTIETYMASIGEEPTHDAFIAAARNLSKSNWDLRFRAIRVINYVRQGFDKPPLAE